MEPPRTSIKVFSDLIQELAVLEGEKLSRTVEEKQARQECLEVFLKKSQKVHSCTFLSISQIQHAAIVKQHQESLAVVQAEHTQELEESTAIIRKLKGILDAT